MGQHSPFGARLGAARVDDLRQIIWSDLNTRLIPPIREQRFVRHPLVRGFHRRASREPHQPFDLGVGPRRLFRG